MVNEAGSCGSDVEVNDENRYEQILAELKDRRAVRICFLNFACVLGRTLVQLFRATSKDTNENGSWPTSMQYSSVSTQQNGEQGRRHELKEVQNERRFSKCQNSFKTFEVPRC